jgi:hypothetical protein
LRGLLAKVGCVSKIQPTLSRVAVEAFDRLCRLARLGVCPVAAASGAELWFGLVVGRKWNAKAAGRARSERPRVVNERLRVA